MDFSRLAKRSVKFMVDAIFVMVNRVCVGSRCEMQSKQIRENSEVAIQELSKS
jgi:hypothetical protein